MTQVATSVKEVTDQEVEMLLGTGAGSIMVPNETTEEAPKKDFFKAPNETAFLDTPGKVTIKEEEPIVPVGTEKVTPIKPITTTPADLAVLDLTPETTTNTGEEEDEDSEEEQGFSKSSGIVKLTESFIKKGLIIPFDGEEDVTKYKVKDHEELWEMNLKKIKEEALAETQETLFNSVSPQVQAVLEYELNGGTDLKSLFQALSASEEIQNLDISTEYGQEQVLRAHLQAIKYGSPDEIEEEINAFKDRGDLAKKAKMAQPKLKGMQDNVVKQRLAYQQQVKAQRQEQSRLYTENVYNIIEKGTLGGLPMDSNTQGLLFNGLTQSNYQSAQGGTTNLLGHLLEKNQWEKPNHELIAEVLWLMADRDGYHAKIKEGAKKTVEQQVIRTLKDSTKDNTASGAAASSEETPVNTRQTLKRNVPKRRMFGRD